LSGVLEELDAAIVGIARDQDVSGTSGVGIGGAREARSG
jgi:hypothetical protein